MPGTSASIETAYINSFRAGFEQAFQQQESVFLPYVQVVNQQSEYEYYDRIGTADEPTEDTTRYGDNPVSEIEFDRRRIHFRDYELGKYIDPKDLHRVATDPTNDITQNMTYSFRRKLDDIVVDGFFGPAYTGKEGQTTVEFVSDYNSTLTAAKIAVGAVSKGHSNPITTAGDYQLVPGNYEGIRVDAQYGAQAATGLTLEKLLGLKKTLLRLDASSPEAPIDLWIGSQQWEDLLKIDKLINLDYATRARLESGNVTEWMGFRFHLFERLPTNSNGQRRCIAMASNNRMGKNAVKLALAQPISVDMWRDTARKNIPYIYGKMRARAHRFWGEISAEVVCKE